MNINSHVQLPNCVLRNFRDETDPEKKVWYLDVRTGDILRKSSKKLGTRKGYYSEAGERFWAENIENLNETRFSNSFIEKRVSSCLQSLEKPRLFFFIC